MYRPVRFILAAALLSIPVQIATPVQIEAQTTGPSNGSLVIVGGAMQDPAILRRFLDLAGGPDAPIVVIPTAGGADEYDQFYQGLRAWRAVGATNLTVLHTNDRSEANSEAFIRAIREASGVWLPGGRQWRLMDSYLDTRTEEELWNLLERGGVVGGSSAGATPLGSYLVRGDTRTNTIMMGDHVEGWGFLTNSAIDQHLLKRNRQFDLIEVIQAHPELLGIGLDENTAIVVTGNQFEVIGQSYVAIYDNDRMIGDHGFFYLLAPGDRFDLVTREAVRPSRAVRPVQPTDPERWPGR
ncbi:MAG TPA: cyanophycinase [Gemmatimonadetes bacterium]|nr:cyanophycinase [Gemmatimonadota bacterium]